MSATDEGVEGKLELDRIDLSHELKYLLVYEEGKMGERLGGRTI
jgi:hypothetical protein